MEPTRVVKDHLQRLKYITNLVAGGAVLNEDGINALGALEKAMKVAGDPPGTREGTLGNPLRAAEEAVTVPGDPEGTLGKRKMIVVKKEQKSKSKASSSKLSGNVGATDTPNPIRNSSTAILIGGHNGQGVIDHLPEKSLKLAFRKRSGEVWIMRGMDHDKSKEDLTISPAIDSMGAHNEDAAAGSSSLRELYSNDPTFIYAQGVGQQLIELSGTGQGKGTPNAMHTNGATEVISMSRGIQGPSPFYTWPSALYTRDAVQSSPKGWGKGVPNTMPHTHGATQLTSMRSRDGGPSALYTGPSAFYTRDAVQSSGKGRGKGVPNTIPHTHGATQLTSMRSREGGPSVFYTGDAGHQYKTKTKEPGCSEATRNQAHAFTGGRPILARNLLIEKLLTVSDIQNRCSGIIVPKGSIKAHFGSINTGGLEIIMHDGKEEERTWTMRLAEITQKVGVTVYRLKNGSAYIRHHSLEAGDRIQIHRAEPGKRYILSFEKCSTEIISLPSFDKSDLQGRTWRSIFRKTITILDITLGPRSAGSIVLNRKDHVEAHFPNVPNKEGIPMTFYNWDNVKQTWVMTLMFYDLIHNARLYKLKNTGAFSRSCSLRVGDLLEILKSDKPDVKYALKTSR